MFENSTLNKDYCILHCFNEKFVEITSTAEILCKIQCYIDITSVMVMMMTAMMLMIMMLLLLLVLQSVVIRELEGRVQQLSCEAQTLNDERNVLARDKMEAEGRIERLETDLEGFQNRLYSYVS